MLCAGPDLQLLGVAQVRTSNSFLIGMLGILAAATFALGPVAM